MAIFGPMISPIFGQRKSGGCTSAGPNRKSHGRGERLHEDEGRDPGLRPWKKYPHQLEMICWSGRFPSSLLATQKPKSQANMDDLGVPLFQETPIFFCLVEMEFSLLCFCLACFSLQPFFHRPWKLLSDWAQGNKQTLQIAVLIEVNFWYRSHPILKGL